MSRRKKGNNPIPPIERHKAPTMIALWIGKAPRETLFPKFIIWAIIFHTILFCIIFLCAKNFIETHNPPKPKVKDIEFKVTKTSTKYKPKKIKKTVAVKEQPTSTPVAQSEPTAIPAKPKSILPTWGKANNTPSPAKTTASTFSQPQQEISELDDNDLMPSSKIKRASSGASKGSTSSTGQTSGVEGTSGGTTSGTSSQGKSQGTGSIAAYDISPYINELKRNVRLNWKIPPTPSTKKVELFLRIAKDGRLTILNVKTTSEIGDLDESTLNAVRRSMPLRPLPAKYTKNYLDIVFTFNPTNSSVR